MEEPLPDSFPEQPDTTTFTEISMKRFAILALLSLINCHLADAQQPTAAPQEKLATKIGGRFILDGIGYFNDTDTLHHQANITDLRLTGTATYGDWFMRIDVGYDGNRLGMKDTFLQYSKNGHYLRFGHMLNAFGIDPAVSTYDYQFINCANSTSLLYFGRHIGMVYLKSASKYYVSLNAFAGDNIGNINRSLRQGYNFSGRAVYRPFTEDTKLLQIGTSVLYRKPDQDTETGISNITFSSTGVTGLASPDYQYLSIDNARNQIQANAEFLMVMGKWMFQGEYLFSMTRRAEGKNLRTHGGYLQGGYMILGTGYGYDFSEAVPSAPLQPKALQLIARYNISDLNDSKANLFGGNMQDVSVGLTYQFNKHVSSRLIYSWVNLDQHSPLGAGDLHMLQARIAFWL